MNMKNRTERDLGILMEDLFKRLPYNIICKVENLKGLYVLHGLVCEDLEWYAELWSYNDFEYNISKISIDKITPYLKPIESMTENEKILFCHKQDNTLYGQSKTSLEYAKEWVTWCYENHYDIDNLIGKDLALDGTKLGIHDFDSVYEDLSDEIFHNLKNIDEEFIARYYKDLCFIRDYKEGNSLLK